MSKWIKCSERMPSDGEQIIYIYRDPEYGSYHIRDGSRYYSKTWREYQWDGVEYVMVDTDVTHWMPLPEPPK